MKTLQLYNSTKFLCEALDEDNKRMLGKFELKRHEM